MVCNYKYPISQSINPITSKIGGFGRCVWEKTIYMSIALRYMEIGNSIEVHGNSTTDDEDKTIHFGSQNS